MATDTDIKQRIGSTILFTSDPIYFPLSKCVIGANQPPIFLKTNIKRKREMKKLARDGTIGNLKRLIRVIIINLPQMITNDGKMLKWQFY